MPVIVRKGRCWNFSALACLSRPTGLPFHLNPSLTV